MHFYPHNIADYRKDTRFLTKLQHWAYRELLDEYYLSEQPITNNEKDLFWRMGATTDEEQQAIKTVLHGFFEETENGFIHKRCDAEIQIYKEIAEKRSRAGKASGISRNRSNTCSTHVQQNEDDVQQTNTQEPSTKNKEPKNIYKGKSDRFDDFWKVWPSSERKQAKAECKKKWESKGLDEFADKIITHVEKMKLTDQWQRGFEPMPSTYINQSRYLDLDDVDAQAGLPPNMMRRAI